MNVQLKNEKEKASKRKIDIQNSLNKSTNLLEKRALYDIDVWKINQGEDMRMRTHFFIKKEKNEEN